MAAGANQLEGCSENDLPIQVRRAGDRRPDGAAAAMHAQVIELQLEPERLEVLERLVRSELVPALREQSGFCGALNLTDRERGETLLVLLWEREDEAARTLAQSAALLGQAFATVPDLVAARLRSVTVWEVDARA